MRIVGTMASSSTAVKNLLEIKRLEGKGFELWKDHM
jgi:hypothetical protein